MLYIVTAQAATGRRKGRALGTTRNAQTRRSGRAESEGPIGVISHVMDHDGSPRAHRDPRVIPK